MYFGLRSVVILDHIRRIKKVFYCVFVPPEQIAILAFGKQIVSLFANILLLALLSFNFELHYLSNPLQILFSLVWPNEEQNPFVNAFQNQLEAFPKD